MKTPSKYLGIATAFGLVAVTLTFVFGGGKALADRPAREAVAPEFTGIDKWIDSPPLTMAQLRGKVVLVDFWTSTCINCIHTLPYVAQWDQKYRSQGLKVIGVHTPEYPSERDTNVVIDAMKRFGIRFPVAQDNEYATWNAYGNQFWPAFYLVDKKGRIVYTHFGEGQYEQTEARIRQLLAEQD